MERFIVQENDIVYDKETNLEWFVGNDKDTTWDEAKAWVNSLNSSNFAGGNWRMPSRRELISLYKKGEGTRNMTPLLKTIGWWVWSGEVGSSSSAWLFHFYHGNEHSYNRNGSYSSRAFAVRSQKQEKKDNKNHIFLLAKMVIDYQNTLGSLPIGWKKEKGESHTLFWKVGAKRETMFSAFIARDGIEIVRNNSFVGLIFLKELISL